MQGTYLTPGQRFDGLHSWNKVELFQKHFCSLLKIHGIEMQPSDTKWLCQNSPAHFCYEFGTELPDLLVIVLDRLENIHERLGNDGLGEASCPQETVPSLNGCDTRDDGDGDTVFADTMYPFDENFDVIEHLSEDEVAAGVDLFFQPDHLLLELFRGQQHVLRESSNGNIKVVAIVVTDVLDQVDSVDETAFDGLPLILASRRVPAQS